VRLNVCEGKEVIDWSILENLLLMVKQGLMWKLQKHRMFMLIKQKRGNEK